MEKRELQKLLSQPYSQENWKQIVQFVFPNVSILSSPKEFPINNEKIKKFRQIGSVRLNDGKNLALFELLLADTVNLHRNRVELNNEISKYIDQEQIHGVLSVFEQGADDYRFTFSARSTEFDEEESDFVQKKTDTKRYTYVLGKNESCKTPADRFYKLSENKSEVDINAIQNAFSVEQLSKEFFDKYKKQFEKFWKYIDSKEEYNNVFINGQGEREVKIRNFTKKLLGRIVFLHFLQKKGWMGCPENESWGSGDKKFMQTLFKDFTNKDQFHSQCLVELFYNTLNTKRDNFLFKCEGLEGALNNSKIPYLNGGLFDSDQLESTKIDFPESYFQDLFDFFGQYNFTIDENDPNDHEVGIDPEMLGHIFENLLEDNKDKGAFYTPKVIVQYMCQESLIEYLATKLEAEPSGEVKQAIEDLIRNRLAEDISDLDLVEPIAQALFDVKICDPAIGSGAFPMGILNVIYQVIEALYYLQPDSVARVWNISDTQWQPHLVKKNIIQHSIYGVDIESGAVDIARLRFWLALVVDEVEPLPLPNLDYKIMQGNSLLESFEGIDLSQISDAAAYEAVYESEQIDMFSGEAKKKVSMSLQFEDVKTLMDDYFNANDPETKKDLHKRIDDQVLNHIRFTLAEHKRELQKKAKKLEKKVGLDQAAARTWEQKEKIRTNSKAAKALVKLNNELSQHNGKEIKLAQISNSNERPFFLWHLFFQEAFNKGGFDIVIANPPYLKERDNAHIFDPVNNSFFGEKWHQGKMDFWYYFLHKSIDISSEKGVISFITSRYWLNSDGAKKIIQRVRNSAFFVNVVDIGKLKVFHNVAGHHMIHTYSKARSNDKFIYKKLTNDVKHIILNVDTSNIKISELKNSKVFQEDEIIFSDSIFSKIEILNTLGDFYNVSQGVVEAADKISNKQLKKYKNKDKFDVGQGVFVLEDHEYKNLNLNQKEKSLFKKYLDPNDVSFYKIRDSKKRLLYSDNIVKTEIQSNIDYSGVKEHLDNFSPFITSSNKPYGLHRAREEKFFEKPKIIFKGMFKEPEFCLDTEGYYFGFSFSSIIQNESKKSLKYLLAILNSKLAMIWFSTNGKQRGTGVDIGVKKLRKFPINYKEDFVPVLEKLVDKISNHISDEIDHLEVRNLIDFIVYKVYELSYEEVLIIDQNFSTRIPKKEYDSFSILNK